jgi:hypothetical protein
MKTNSPQDKPPSRSANARFKNGGKTVPHPRSPRFTGTELRRRLTSFDRAPFTDLLAEWLLLVPSREAVTALAETDPAKFMTALASLAKMSGFSDKTETSIDITHNYRVLSDSQIEDRLRALAHQAGIPPSRLLTATAVTIPEEPEESEPSAPSGA